ncbi:hypothetical protein UIS43_07240 [Nocardiopsis sp. LDBS0036]|uniref:hypothetical protein n=1 Tax=Nocardiopsis sp. LDBS0036 TaxID=3104276 RepID=UPI003518020A
MTGVLIRARWLLLFGDQAEVTIPERDHTEPVRVPATETADAVWPRPRELPGRESEVVFPGTPVDPVLPGWRLV